MLPLIKIGYWVVVGLFLFVLAAAAVSDTQKRRIPNWTVLATIILFAGWIFAAPSISLVSSLEAAGVAFVGGYALYAFKIMGAGDAKLFAAVALFVGMGNLLQFAVVTSLAGGVLALVSLVANPTRALVMIQLRGKGDFGPGIPYGVAIAIGGALTVLRTSLGFS